MIKKFTKNISILQIKYTKIQFIKSNKTFHKNIQSKNINFQQKYFFFSSNGKFNVQKDYYAILGLNKQATQSQIKKQYYNLAKQYHPDVNKNANQKFKLINQAYQTLSNQQLKAEYDQARKMKQAQEKFNQRRKQYNNPNYGQNSQNQYQNDQNSNPYHQYQQHYYKNYRRAYQQMDQYDRYLLKKHFSKIMIKLFLYGFGFTLIIALLFGGPRKYYFVDQFGRPVDETGRPIDRYGRPIMQNTMTNPGYNEHDPYGLAGIGGRKQVYPPQNVYGQQYVANAQPNSGQNQDYY